MIEKRIELIIIVFELEWEISWIILYKFASMARLPHSYFLLQVCFSFVGRERFLFLDSFEGEALNPPTPFFSFFKVVDLLLIDVSLLLFF